MLRRRVPFLSRAFPGFTDLSEIGGSAFATVYRAIEAETGRPVALKVLKVGTVGPHLLEAFDQEIRALAAISNHPNIVTLYRSLRAADGRPMLVLELCRESLAQRVRRAGPLPARDVVSIGVKIAGALETAHSAGFLHRNMKPQNILTTEFAEPALADFGVVALQASTQANESVFGFTTLHAPPEWLEGHRLSTANDIYGLASSLYQLLVGRPPFAAFEGEPPAAVLLRILRDPVPPPRGEGIPAALSDLLEAGLAKRPDERPASAQTIADRLRDIEAANGWSPSPYIVWSADDTASVSAAADPASLPMDRVVVAPPVVVADPTFDPGSSPAAMELPEAPAGPPAPSRAETGPNPLRQSATPSPAHGGPSVVRPKDSPRRVISPTGGPLGDRRAPARADDAPSTDCLAREEEESRKEPRWR